MRRESTPSPKEIQKKDNSLSPYLKSQKKKDAMTEFDYSKGILQRKPLVFGAPSSTMQQLLMSFPEINKIHPEVTQLKGYHVGPVRPATEGKKIVTNKPEVRTENSGMKPSSASRRPASPNVAKPNCNLYHDK